MDEKYQNPWQTITTQLIYENDWIRVREDQVIRPDGKPGIYGVVEYHKCVGVLPIDEHGNVHLVGQYRYPLNCYSWEIPEGGCQVGETPLAAAHRELQEELGLQAQEFTFIGISHLSNSVSNEEAHIFIARNLSHGTPQPEGSEKLEQRIVPFSAALQMVLAGSITDSMSQIAILRYAVMQAEQRN